MIKITITDVGQAIKNQKGPLAYFGAKVAARLGVADPLKLAEEKIAQKIRETLQQEGVIANVEIDPD